MSDANYAEVLSRIESRTAVVGVIGLGYVGLPAVWTFAEAGFRVLGFDIDEGRIDLVNSGRSYILDVKQEDFQSVFKSGRISATADFSKLPECDAILICVPTPFTENKDPDVSHVVEAGRRTAEHMRVGQLVILKSTTYPETTEKVLLPILEGSGLIVGTDFWLAFSPERVDPGNKKFNMKNTPVVVGGVTAACTQLTRALLETACERVVEVSTPRVAEMSKLLENIFRSVNIALVNELARLCDRMGNIDIWAVIDAASTKPFGFMPFYPGPGIGGHCILVDPYYLSWKAREYDFHTNFIELAAETNEEMPYYVVNMVFEGLSHMKVIPSEATVLVLGAAFKRDISDTRNSPAVKVMELLKPRVHKLSYNDPYVSSLDITMQALKSIDLTAEIIEQVDCVLIATDHSCYDYSWIVSKASLVVDTRNATKGLRAPHIMRLGSIGSVG